MTFCARLRRIRPGDSIERFGKMKSVPFLTQIFTGVIILSLMGCGYTILRDFDEEARQAELAAIDSLSSSELPETKV
jgi:hypothetical protein